MQLVYISHALNISLHLFSLFLLVKLYENTIWHVQWYGIQFGLITVSVAIYMLGSLPEYGRVVFYSGVIQSLTGAVFALIFHRTLWMAKDKINKAVCHGDKCKLEKSLSDDFYNVGIYFMILDALCISSGVFGFIIAAGIKKEKRKRDAKKSEEAENNALLS
jgi:hypothetical protein